MNIKALVSAAGEFMLQRGRIYTDYPDDVCKEFIKIGYAELIEEKRVVAEQGQTASIKQNKRK